MILPHKECHVYKCNTIVTIRQHNRQVFIQTQQRASLFVWQVQLEHMTYITLCMHDAEFTKV